MHNSVGMITPYSLQTKNNYLGTYKNHTTLQTIRITQTLIRVRTHLQKKTPRNILVPTSTYNINDKATRITEQETKWSIDVMKPVEITEYDITHITCRLQ